MSTQNVNVARFARNVEWDFFCDFQTPWGSPYFKAFLEIPSGAKNGKKEAHVEKVVNIVPDF